MYGQNVFTLPGALRVIPSQLWDNHLRKMYAAEGCSRSRPRSPVSFNFFVAGDSCRGVEFRDYLEGQGDLVSRLVTPITHIVTEFIPIINLLTKSP